MRCVGARVTRRGCVDVADATKSGVDGMATRVRVVRFAVERIDVGVSASLTEAVRLGCLVGGHHHARVNEYEMLLLHAKEDVAAHDNSF